MAQFVSYAVASAWHLSPLLAGDAILAASRQAKNSSREAQHLARASRVGVGSASTLLASVKLELENGHMEAVKEPVANVTVRPGRSEWWRGSSLYFDLDHSWVPI